MGEVTEMWDGATDPRSRDRVRVLSTELFGLLPEVPGRADLDIRGYARRVAQAFDQMQARIVELTALVQALSVGDEPPAAGDASTPIPEAWLQRLLPVDVHPEAWGWTETTVAAVLPHSRSPIELHLESGVVSVRHEQPIGGMLPLYEPGRGMGSVCQAGPDGLTLEWNGETSSGWRLDPPADRSPFGAWALRRGRGPGLRLVSQGDELAGGEDDG